MPDPFPCSPRSPSNSRSATTGFLPFPVDHSQPSVCARGQFRGLADAGCGASPGDGQDDLQIIDDPKERRIVSHLLERRHDPDGEFAWRITRTSSSTSPTSPRLQNDYCRSTPSSSRSTTVTGSYANSQHPDFPVDEGEALIARSTTRSATAHSGTTRSCSSSTTSTAAS